MNIYPDDLGSQCCQDVLESRMWCVGTDGANATSPLSTPPSGHVQAPARHKPNFIPEFLIAGLGMTWTASQAFHISMGYALLLLGLFALLWWRMRGRLAYTRPAMRRKLAEQQTSAYSQLTETEINLLQNSLLRKGCDDSLMGAYLDLVWSAISLPPFKFSQSETEQNVREAIQALGGAIEALPPRMMEGVPDSLVKLQALAARLAAEAPLEPDPVIAASLWRRAEALQGQIETMTRVKTILRRNVALRDELADQISALGTSLAAVTLDQEGGGSELALLAASIQRVALEANAVTSARVEVDTLLSEPIPNPPVSVTKEVERQVLRNN
jgi:hypothetical protein